MRTYEQTPASVGRVIKGHFAPAPYTIRCFKCRHEAHGKDEGEAIRKLSQHIVARHMPKVGA